MKILSVRPTTLKIKKNILSVYFVFQGILNIFKKTVKRFGPRWTSGRPPAPLFGPLPNVHRFFLLKTSLIKSRRIKYLHYLLNSPPGEMLTNVFKAQVRNQLKGDWVQIVKKDLEDFEISASFENIAKMKEELFKKEVTNACQKYTFKELMKEKEKREKGENLTYKKLDMQSYLYCDKIKSRDAKFLFKIRTEMLDVRKNFETKYQNNTCMTCPVCHSHTDTQQELINCSALNTRKNTVRYSDLFSKDLSTVASALNKYQTMWKKREHILMNK